MADRTKKKEGQLLDYTSNTSTENVSKATEEERVEAPSEFRTANDWITPAFSTANDWITPAFSTETAESSWEVPRNIYAETQNLGTPAPTVSTNTPTPIQSQGPVLGTEEFENAWKAYLQENPDDAKYKDFLTMTAQRESNFRSIQNTAGNPAYGYFQLWETNLGGNSPEEVLKDPKKQIQLAIQLLKNNISTFTDKDRKKARELGYSENAL